MSENEKGKVLSFQDGVDKRRATEIAKLQQLNGAEWEQLQTRILAEAESIHQKRIACLEDNIGIIKSILSSGELEKFQSYENGIAENLYGYRDDIARVEGAVSNEELTELEQSHQTYFREMSKHYNDMQSILQNPNEAEMADEFKKRFLK